MYAIWNASMELLWHLANRYQQVLSSGSDWNIGFDIILHRLENDIFLMKEVKKFDFRNVRTNILVTWWA